MKHRLSEPGLELVLGLIDRKTFDDEDLPALSAQISRWIDQASEAPVVQVEEAEVRRRANHKLLEVLSTIAHPGELRDRVREFKHKKHVASVFVASELEKEDVDNACAHHLPGLLVARDKIGGASNIMTAKVALAALSVEMSRKPKLTIMPYQTDYLLFSHVLKVLEKIEGNRLNKEDLLTTLQEIKSSAEAEVEESVRKALHTRSEERYAYCPY